MKKTKEKMKIRDEKRKEKDLKNNIIIHRMVESPVKEGDKKNSEDRKEIITLIKDVLKIPCADKDIKRIFRLGKAKVTKNHYSSSSKAETMKNIVLEACQNSGTRKKNTEKYVTHDMAKSEREQCRNLIKQCKEKQGAEKRLNPALNPATKSGRGRIRSDLKKAGYWPGPGPNFGASLEIIFIYIVFEKS
ncbi:hypothetical protein HELRODRAFT_181286 [Helobdella robusta]|uniref:Uncharacterized protein n=1 Tax=Helobdella robusta TaxID=6412 RepID=T1FGU5_HELRO|nr:hypothetical protein HELRODRAFT_181286 [Helobdella robusta]ESN93173.1 hypothetical protein HELRODRAFT_181286 [Helobdella robusta]